MKCTWEDVSIDAQGRRVVKCVRCGWISKPTPHSHDKIHRNCTALPMPHEWGHWLAFLLSMFGLTKGRYIAAKAAIGLNPSCGCDRRESSYNALGARFAAFVRWLRGS